MFSFLAKGWYEQSQGVDQSYEGVFSINFTFIHVFLFRKFSSGKNVHQLRRTFAHNISLFVLLTFELDR